MVDGSVIIWKHWEAAWEWCKDREINPVAPHHKLNKDYIYLTTQAQMRNIYAEETLNIRMLLLMEAYQASLSENEGKKLSATIQFLQKTSKENRDVLAWFLQWEKTAKRATNLMAWFLQWEKTAKRATNLMSAECREDLSWMVIGFEHFVKRMTQKKVPIPHVISIVI